MSRRHVKVAKEATGEFSMPATDAWTRRANYRAVELEKRGVFWRHDRNPKRPYVRLRSGLISDGYFNGSVLSESPALLDYVVSELIHEYLSRKENSRYPNRIIGPAMGAITFTHEVARQLDNRLVADGQIRMSYAEKDGDQFVFKRNPPILGEHVMFVEDTITTAGSIRKVRDATLRTLGKISYEEFLLVLCNRSGETRLDFEMIEVISYVDADFRTWKEGENPFTSDGRELVPVVEDAKQNWHLLTQAYE